VEGQNPAYRAAKASKAKSFARFSLLSRARDMRVAIMSAKKTATNVAVFFLNSGYAEGSQSFDKSKNNR